MPKTVTVCELADLPPGQGKIIEAEGLEIGLFNCGGEIYAIEDRCSHDDGPLAEGEHDPERGVVICPRHGSEFDICSGRPLSLPAYAPVETFPVVVEQGVVKVDVR